MGEGDLCGPISLESVDADVAVGGHVGVVDLGQEEPSGRRVREVVAQDELDVERAAVVRRPDCLGGREGRKEEEHAWVNRSPKGA